MEKAIDSCSQPKASYGVEDNLSDEIKELLVTLPREKHFDGTYLYQFDGIWHRSIFLAGMISSRRHFEPQDSDLLVGLFVLFTFCGCFCLFFWAAFVLALLCCLAAGLFAVALGFVSRKKIGKRSRWSAPTQIFFICVGSPPIGGDPRQPPVKMTGVGPADRRERLL
ncbi:hypothetical protein LWI28_009019 [Acer negundo]|uniref:Uncharacterized protein n=1 Tax=Acer negundo TaxID=4023 RepID=A0AAD5JSM4_ACENE|nr:hypothetical protein LWI28_009019 [Acer negundo]